MVIPLLFLVMINRVRHHCIWDRHKFMVEKQFQIIYFLFFLMKYILRYFTKDGYMFRFNCNRELITDC